MTIAEMLYVSSMERSARYYLAKYGDLLRKSRAKSRVDDSCYMILSDDGKVLLGSEDYSLTLKDVIKEVRFLIDAFRT